MADTAPAPKPPIEASNWKPIDPPKNTLLGFVSLTIVSYGIVIHECTVHRKEDRTWVGLPAKPQLDSRTGQALTDAAGKIKYVPLVIIEQHMRDRFQQRALDALRAIGAIS